LIETAAISSNRRKIGFHNLAPEDLDRGELVMRAAAEPEILGRARATTRPGDDVIEI
jgi:hypothetical protein